MVDHVPLGALSTITALGDMQLPAPRLAPHLERQYPRANARYTHLGTIGRGGACIVDRVWDGDLMRDVAVKRLRPELRANTQLVSRFLWEARVGAYLDHPNIVPVHDLGVGPDGPFFTMKRVVGRSLADLLVEVNAGDAAAREKLPLARRLRVIHQVCLAVAFAHRRGVLHRDLRPSNVLLGEEGEVLVTDWGLAVPVPGPTGDELRSVMPVGLGDLNAGAPLYMSPEQARSEPLDERSDVYALGVMLYETATGVHPFEGTSGTETAVGSEPRRIRDAWPGVPRPLATIVERAMAHDPSDRYQSAARLAVDLERVIDDHTPPERDGALAHLRVADYNMLVASGWSLGIGTGVMASTLIRPYGWIACALAAIVALPPTMRYIRARAIERNRS